MPFALITVGLILIVAAYKNTHRELLGQIRDDMVGPNGFVVWFGALLIVGAVGYITRLQTFSRVVLTLIVVVIILRNQGLFDNFAEALRAAGTGPGANPAPGLIDPAAPPADNRGAPSEPQTPPRDDLGGEFGRRFQEMMRRAFPGFGQ